MEAVICKNLSKRFVINREKSSYIKHSIIDLFKRKQTQKEIFWALKNASFEVFRGETFGIIGRNGSGKSTLLKIIARILESDSGSIVRNGKIAALLELGSGFHPDLSGRDNIYLNGSILGLSKRQIRERIMDIIEFSGLQKFVDTKVKNYSSGMLMRLGFSIAIHLDTEILLFDEILAVGDENFQEKCLKKISDIRDQGKTIIFVSHDLGSVRQICDRAMLLHKGRVRGIGDVDYIIELYHTLLEDQKRHHLSGFEDDIPGSTESKAGETEDPLGVNMRWGNQQAVIQSVAILAANNEPREKFHIGDSIRVLMEYNAPKRIARPTFGIGIHREDGVHICGPNSTFSGQMIDFIEGEGYVEFLMPNVNLMPGMYQLSVSLYNEKINVSFDHHNRMYDFEILKGEHQEVYGLVHIPHQFRKIK